MPKRAIKTLYKAISGGRIGIPSLNPGKRLIEPSRPFRIEKLDFMGFEAATVWIYREK